LQIDGNVAASPTPPPMKTFETLTRHSITWLFGILVTWLTIYLSADDLKTATEAVNALIEPLVIVAGFVAVILVRLAMPFLNKIFRRGAGENSDGETGAGSAGGLVPLLLLCLGIAALLPGCQTLQDYPFTASISYRDPASGAKAGLSYSPDKKLKGGVTVPIYDAQTGELLGVTDVVIGDSAK
jgi:hypothetical protein